MKPVTIPSRAKVLNGLLKKARRRNIILESVDGERFVLAFITHWQGFDVGNSQDFAVEVKRTAQNKKLAKLMAERRAKDKSKPRFSSEDIRKELGLT